MRKREAVCGDEKEYINIIVTGDRRKRDSKSVHSSMITVHAY